MAKQRTPFAGRQVKADGLLGIKHTIVAKEKKRSKQRGHEDETYYDVQAIAEGLGLIRYTTGAKQLVAHLDSESIPIRDLHIDHDWRGLYYRGTVYTDAEEADMIRQQFNIDY